MGMFSFAGLVRMWRLTMRRRTLTSVPLWTMPLHSLRQKRWPAGFLSLLRDKLEDRKYSHLDQSARCWRMRRVQNALRFSRVGVSDSSAERRGGPASRSSAGARCHEDHGARHAQRGGSPRCGSLDALTSRPALVTAICRPRVGAQRRYIVA